MYRYRLPLALGALICLVLSAIVVAGSLNPRNVTQAQAASSSDDWTTYLFDKGHSGYNPNEKTITTATASKLQLLWTGKSSSGTVISTQPITANGMVYWGDWGGIMHASKPNGATVWTANLGQMPTPSTCSGRTKGILSSPTATTVTINGTATPVLFATGGTAVLYALNALTGTILWKNQLGVSPDELWGAPNYYNKSIYIGLSAWSDCPLVQAKIFQLNGSTGTIQNTYNVVPNGCTGASVWGSVTIDTSNKTLYFATGNGGSCSSNETTAEAVVELHTSNLSFVSSWQVPSSQQISDGDFGDTPTIFTATLNGTTHRLIGVANKNGIYYALDEANIAAGPVWKDSLAVPGSGPEAGQGSISPSAWDGTHLFVAGGNTTINGQNCQGGLREVNPATGAFIWQTCFMDGPVLGSVTEVPGVIALGEGDALVLLNASNGQTLFKKWDTTTSGLSNYYGGPAIANGTVYIGNEDGNFYAYGGLTSPTPTVTPSQSPTALPSPSPGITLAQDTFQRPNQSLWGTASDGQTWGGDANTQSVFSIANNTGQVANATNTYSAVLGPSATNAEVLFSGSMSSFTNNNLGAVLRWTDDNNWYKAYIDGASLIVQKKVSGATTNIGSVPFTATAGTSYTLRFRVVGTTLYAKVWQTGTTEPTNWMVTVTDTTFSSGFCGLRMLAQNGAIATYTSFLATAQ